MESGTLAYKRGAGNHFSKSKQAQKSLGLFEQDIQSALKFLPIDHRHERHDDCREAATIPEGNGGREMMIQPMHITWTELNGKVGVMQQWANVQFISDLASTNPRVDIKLLRPIEWNLKPIEKEKGGEPVNEKGAKTEEEKPDV